ncbi:H-NS histone [Salinicola sp. MH3R3-1]|uniref:histone-like nucleoid-structuring protein, MvaT/MvaU family n=1 Tax=Salinicola sp. MH3R3-1 TaxID=1928762 RepID=UPI00094F03C0|nr:histone-like nucleoid-structuring protein, MvaT/MvaU family [Salinicola sp. MH3R3-1]OLO06762.1 H-NS histone [Salinicola sp. MH3R3-1]
MSLLSEYTKKEQLLKQLSEELKALESDQRLKNELEFKDKLEALMTEYDKKAKDVIDLLSPDDTRSVPQSSTANGRRKRKLKIYKNPNTGEVIETRGGNHKALKAWKDEHGSETVEGWVVREEQ